MIVSRIICHGCGRPIAYCACFDPHQMADAIWRVYGSGRDTPRIVGLTASDDTPRRGVPPYTPTEEQPARCGQGE